MAPLGLTGEQVRKIIDGVDDPNAPGQLEGGTGRFSLF
jgi:hypothetical protein